MPLSDCCTIDRIIDSPYANSHADPPGNGIDIPFTICTPDQLNAIGENPADRDKHFVLVNDIDMSGYRYTTAVIAPDTDHTNETYDGTSFTGIFDRCRICHQESNDSR